SRSSSLASHTISACFERAFNSATSFFLSLLTIYLGVKSPSTSTPNSLLGRSAIWPKLEETLKSFPRNFSIVFAFAGDSTITKFFAIFIFVMRTKVCEFFYTRDFEVKIPKNQRVATCLYPRRRTGGYFQLFR